MSINELPKRKPHRLRNYDYSQNGCYFVTVCTKNKRHLLGHYRSKRAIVGAGLRARPRDAVILSQLGREVEKSVRYIEKLYSHIRVENYIIMPNHIHLLLTYDNYDESGTTGGRGDPPLQDVIGRLKSYTTAIYRKMENNDGLLWQRSFYDRVIRSQAEYEKMMEYIEFNALKEY